MLSIVPLLEALAKTQGSRFANITYTNKVGGKVITPETSRFHLILGASTENMYQTEIEKLEDFIYGAWIKTEVQKLAAIEMLDSRKESLEKGVGNNSRYTNADTYISFDGLRIHKETGEVYVSGLEQSKTVIVAGTYKTVKSSPKTLAKAHIAKVCGFSKFRLFTLDNISRAALNGNVLEIENP